MLESTGIAFYSSQFTLLLVFVGINLLFRNRIGLSYSILLLLGLGLVSCLDGTLISFIEPGLRQVPMWLPTSAMCLLSASGFVLASQYSLRPKDRQGVLNLWSVLAIASALLPLGLPWSQSQWIGAIAVGLFLLMLVAQAITVRSWFNEDGDEESSYGRQASWLGLRILLALAGISVALGLLLLSITDLTAAEIDKALSRSFFTFANIGIFVMVLMQIQGARRDKDVAQLKAVRQAQRLATQNEKRRLAEQRYVRLTEQVSNTSHDMKQPLLALENALLQITRQGDSPIGNTLQQALRYLRQLIDNYEPEAPASVETTEAAQGHSVAESRSEIIPVELLQRTLQQMFEGEAHAANIRFRIAPSSLAVRANPIEMVRVLSNFISNVIAHSASSDLLIGARRSGDKLRLEVHDNGCGIAQDKLSGLFERGIKGEGSQGEGIGLYNVQQIAENAGFRINVKSRVGKGTCFSIETPLAN